MFETCSFLNSYFIHGASGEIVHGQMCDTVGGYEILQIQQTNWGW